MLRVFFGHHKCASRAARAILRTAAEYQDARLWTYSDFLVADGPKFEFWDLPAIDDPIRLADIPDGHIVGYIDATPDRLDELRAIGRPFRAVEVVRDPRNVLVSGYAHHKGAHPVDTERWRWRLLEALQPALRTLDVDAGLRLEMNTVFRQIMRQQFSLATSPHPEIRLLRVEQLATDREAFVAELGAWLELGAIVDEHPAEADPGSYRTVDPDDWRDVLRGELLDDFMRDYGSLVRELGYSDTAPVPADRE